MDIHLSYAFHNMIEQLRTSSHQLDIDVGRYAQIPLEEKTFQLCQQGVEFEEHYVCHCTDFNEISGR